VDLEILSNRLIYRKKHKTDKNLFNLIYTVTLVVIFTVLFCRKSTDILPITFQNKVVFKSRFPENEEYKGSVYFIVSFDSF
jgi:hypothetical protein